MFNQALIINNVPSRGNLTSGSARVACSRASTASAAAAAAAAVGTRTTPASERPRLSSRSSSYLRA
jgi:hypothetical protein